MWHKSTWIRASIVAPVAFFYLSFLCVLNESSNCLTFLHHELPRVSSNCLHERIQSHIGCICLTFLHYAFSNISSKCLYESRRSHTDCICLIFLHCVLSNKSLMHLDQSMQSFFCVCFFKCMLKLPAREVAQLQLLHLIDLSLLFVLLSS